MALTVLLTVTVNAYEDDPVCGTDAGEGKQLNAPGAPQVTETVPLKPLAGETCRLYVAV
jgi:hypothetical protein